MGWGEEGKLYIGQAASSAQQWAYMIPGGYQRNYGALGVLHLAGISRAAYIRMHYLGVILQRTEGYWI